MNTESPVLQQTVTIEDFPTTNFCHKKITYEEAKTVCSYKQNVRTKHTI